MFHKVLLTGVLLVVGTLVFWGTSLKSYLQTAWGRVNVSVQDSIPLDFEIDRARQMARDIVPEIRQNMQSVAREEVAIQELQEKIRKLQEQQARDRSEMSRLKTDLDAGGTAFRYGGRTYTVSQVKGDLSHRLARCKTNDATLEQLNQILQAREQGLSAARQKLDQMLVGKRQLEAEVENLEARLKMLEVAETAGNQQLTDSQYGRVRELVADLSSRLQVAEKISQSTALPIGEIPVDEAPQGEISDQVAEYLGQSEPAETTVVVKE